MRNKPLPGFAKNIKSPLKQGGVDLTKKSGFGPSADETDITRYEMGNPLGIENPVALDKLYEKTEKPRQ